METSEMSRAETAVVEAPDRAVAAEAPAAAAPRVTSIDAYRGFVMLLMASEGLGISKVAKTLANRIARPAISWRYPRPAKVNTRVIVQPVRAGMGPGSGQAVSNRICEEAS